MNLVNILIIAFFGALLPIAANKAEAIECGIYSECRYQGAPKRGSDGKIIRSSAVLYAFKKVHPCPSTLSRTGSCSGWSIDHVVSLECGGIDAVWNLQWLPNSIKSGTDPHNKDRFELKIYAASPPYADTARCVNRLVP